MPLLACVISLPSVAGKATAQPATQPAASVWPLSSPPSAAEIAEGEARVRRTLPEAFEPPATAPAAGPREGAAWRRHQGAFARRFLSLGIGAEANPGERFALFAAARDRAASAGDADVAMQAIGRLATLFDVDPITTRESALAAVRTANEAADFPQQRIHNRQITLLLIEGALAAGDYDLAARAVEVAKADPGRFDDPAMSALLERLTAPDGPLEGVAAEARAAAAARQKLQSDPNDRASLESLGTFLVVTRGDWQAGVPLLAKAAGGAAGEAGAEPTTAPSASLPPLLQAAREEVAAENTPSHPADPAALAAQVGHAWWAAGDRLQGRPRLAARRRAAQWYRRELPRLQGMPLAAGQAHLADLRRSIVQPGLLADVYLGEDFQRLALTRVDPLLDFHWDDVSPDPAVPVEHYSVCWQGFIQSPSIGPYRLIVRADDGVIVNVDGQTLVSAWENGSADHEASVHLTGGLQPITILYFQGAVQAHLHLQWVGPGETNPTLVPASALFHEPVWPWGQVPAVVGTRPAGAIASKRADGSTAWFAPFREALPWPAAERACQRLGGHLAWSRRSEDAGLLGKLAAGTPAWLGATDESAQGRWEWTDGRRVDPRLFNWREGEPPGTQKNFLEIKDNTWTASDGHKPFICEWDEDR